MRIIIEEDEIIDALEEKYCGEEITEQEYKDALKDIDKDNLGFSIDANMITVVFETNHDGVTLGLLEEDAEVVENAYLYEGD